MIRVLAKVGLGYDARVKEWRDSLLATITDEDELVSEKNVCIDIILCMQY